MKEKRSGFENSGTEMTSDLWAFVDHPPRSADPNLTGVHCKLNMETAEERYRTSCLPSPLSVNSRLKETEDRPVRHVHDLESILSCSVYGRQ